MKLTKRFWPEGAPEKFLKKARAFAWLDCMTARPFMRRVVASLARVTRRPQHYSSIKSSKKAARKREEAAAAAPPAQPAIAPGVGQ